MSDEKKLDRAMVDKIKERISAHTKYSLAKDKYTATDYDNFMSVALTVRDMLIERWIKTQQTYYNENAKRVYYLSLEFLIGRTLGNSLVNLQVYDEFDQALRELDLDMEKIRDEELDAGLGNGGLGRLAACFLDSLATLEYPAYGYGIRYDYGIFNQKIIDGNQVEEPDNWLKFGNPWEIERPEYEIRIQFNGNAAVNKDQKGIVKYKWENTKDLLAVPFDIPIPGYANNTVNTLRLWSAKSTNEFDFKDFDSGNYIEAVEDKNKSEVISKVLYPNDVTMQGKVLRLQQQYFFVSASLQDIIRRFKKFNKDIKTFSSKVAVQLNDTHPAIAIPELMKILLSEYELSWKDAWKITVETFGYTNHTLLPEALEKWQVSIMEQLLPVHMKIIETINNDFLRAVSMRYPNDKERLRRMSIIDESGERYVRMAFLAIVGSHSTNGVAKLHSELLKTELLKDFSEFFPERFNNKTNGITQRRWLLKSNPLLASLITKKIGDGWVKDLYQLKNLLNHINDENFINEWQNIKLENKKELAGIIKNLVDVEVDVNSIFDTQIKRLHEYKRQLLNILHVIYLYNEIKSKHNGKIVPRTFIFGAKAAPGYYMAKLIIKLINNVASVINSDPYIQDQIKVVFLPNYRVSLAEHIFPATDVSEQISTAGKEASGTGNMKFALNGALTVGTLDGANVEIAEEVGNENIFIFGLKVNEINELRKKGYNPREYYEKNPKLKSVIDLISNNYFSGDSPGIFQPIIESLVNKDTFMLFADFQLYVDCQEKVANEYLDKKNWTIKCIKNVANIGKFSSDRTIKEYADEIWKAKPVHIDLNGKD